VPPLPAPADALPPAAPAKTLSLPAASVRPGEEFTLIEYACKENSEIAKSCIRQNVKGVHLTLQVGDLCSESGHANAMSRVRDNPGCHVHGSLPCTPWCRYRSININKCGEQNQVKA
jgi:hypothetical protein